MRWLITCAKKRNERTLKEKLAAEILDAYAEKGEAYKNKVELHKNVLANRPFLKFS